MGSYRLGLAQITSQHLNTGHHQRHAAPRTTTIFYSSTMRWFSSFLLLLLLILSCLVSSSQGKQDLVNDSKIHFISLHQPQHQHGLVTTNNSKLRSNLAKDVKRWLKQNKNIKESKKIDINIDFVNNGRPYRINSKKSKMLTKQRRKSLKKTVNLHQTDDTTTIIKQNKNINGDRETLVEFSHDEEIVENGLGDKEEIRENNTKQHQVASVQDKEFLSGTGQSGVTSLGAENWSKKMVKSSAESGAALQTESVNKRNVSRELNQDKNVVEEVVNQRKILKDLVPANTFKLENMKVNLVNKNHVGRVVRFYPSGFLSIRFNPDKSS